MIRFSHTLFALPFALLSMVMAAHQNAHPAEGAGPPVAFRWLDLAGILASMVCARSAAMAFNRLADRRLDALNPRTQSRHLPQRILSVRSVGLFTAACSAAFIAATLLFLPRNPWPACFSVPVLLFLFAYSFAKRFTVLAHFWLGAALALAPVGAWIVLRPELAGPPLVLAAAVTLWVAGFDMIYACQDYEFDRRTGLYSVPARWGVGPALRVAAGCHLGMLALLACLPCVYPPFGRIYAGGVAAIAVLLIYEHLLVRPGDLARVNRAFFHVNAVVSVGLLAAGTVDLWW
jgi:4-hydroxybenzoate polyprenyltransferase